MIVQCWDRWTANELNRARSDLLRWHLRLEKLSALGVLGTLRQNLNLSQSFHFNFRNKKMFINLQVWWKCFIWHFLSGLIYPFEYEKIARWVKLFYFSWWPLNLSFVKDKYIDGRKLARNGQEMAILAGGCGWLPDTNRRWIRSSSLKYFKSQRNYYSRMKYVPKNHALRMFEKKSILSHCSFQ